MATYKTNDFRKGLKVQIDGEPYLMFEMNFVKPGKGNAFYKCKLRNLIRNTVLDRTYKGGESLESADVEDLDVQYIYRQGDTFVFMNEKTYDQYELSSEQVDDNWRYLIEGLKCSMVISQRSQRQFKLVRIWLRSVLSKTVHPRRFWILLTVTSI